MSLIVTPVAEAMLANMRVVGYAHAGEPTDLRAQVDAIRREVGTRGWELVTVFDDADSGGTEVASFGLTGALAALASRDADALVVARLSGLTGSVSRLVELLERFQRNRWVLVALDTAEGAGTDGAGCRPGPWAGAGERPLVGVRTRAGIAARRAAGVRVGGPRRCPDDVLDRVVRLRASGARLVDIAAEMNAAGIVTPGGGSRWWASHVSRLLATQDARAWRGGG
ncbi:MAG TPA: recombinase family protein [Mycobacteriales bacterium]|nr:recombinase family protein [Mycobacteriales bacterium]